MNQSLNNSKTLAIATGSMPNAQHLYRHLGESYKIILTHSLEPLQDTVQLDLALIDINIASLAEISRIVQRHEGIKIAFIDSEDPSDVLQYLCISNVVGLFRKDERIEIILKGLVAIQNNEPFFPRQILRALIRRINLDATDAPPKLERLSRKEHAILMKLSHGQSNNDIARELNLSFHTVKTHVYNIYKKLDVRNRAEATRLAQSVFF